MQKNLSQAEKHAREYWRNTVGNQATGAIIILVAIIISLLSGCEPVLPNDTGNKENTLPSETDSEKQPNINEWDTDTTTYKTQAKPQ